MRLREGAYTPEPSPTSSTQRQGDGVRRWRVSRPVTWARAAGVTAFTGVALAFHAYPDRWWIGAVAALAVGAYLVRDLLVPVRLEADAEGVTVVSGFAGRHRLGWADIERVRVDDRRRLGLRSQLLEIDAGESLFLLSGYELNAPVEDVAADLASIRAAHEADRTPVRRPLP